MQESDTQLVSLDKIINDLNLAVSGLKDLCQKFSIQELKMLFQNNHSPNQELFLNLINHISNPSDNNMDNHPILSDNKLQDQNQNITESNKKSFLNIFFSSKNSSSQKKMNFEKENSVLKQKNQKLTSKNTLLSLRNENLEKQILINIKQIKELNERNKKSNDEKNKFANQLADLRSELTKSHQLNDEITNAYNIVFIQNSEYEQINNKLLDENSFKEQQIISLNNTIESLKQTISKYDKNFKYISSENEKLIQQNNNQQYDIKNLTDKNEQMTSENQSLKNQNENHIQTIQHKTNICQELTKQNEELMKNINKNNMIISDMTNKYNQISSENNTLKHQNETIQSEKNNFSLIIQKITVENQQIPALNQTIEMNNKKSSEYEQTINLLQQSNKNLQEKNLFQSNQISALTEENKKIKQTILNNDQETQKLKEEMQQLTKDNEQYKNKIKSLSDEIKEYSFYKEFLEKINNLNTDLEHRNKILRSENSKKDSQINVLNQKIEISNRSLSEKDNQISQLSSVLQNHKKNKSEEISNLKMSINSLTEENKILLKKIESQEQIIIKLNKIKEKYKGIRSYLKLQQNEANKLKILDKETIQNLETIEDIRAGGSGKVTKVAMKVTYALKIMYAKYSYFEKFITEYEIMNKLHHPNIVNAYGIFMSSESIPPSILLEYCPKNLEEAIKENIFSKEQIVEIIYQIAEGMKCVHFNKVIHRDLKASNILISSNGTIKISDFGISKLKTCKEQTQTPGVGTLKWMAPEMIDEKDNYDEKVDVYSFGVLVYFILSGGNLPEIKVSDILKGKKAKIPDVFTDFSRNLIYECWNFNSNDRPSFQMILDEMVDNHYKLINLNDSEIKNIEIFVQQHKMKILPYDENFS